MDEKLLWELVEICSEMRSGMRDGHFTLMKFTTHWKASFSTPDLDSGKGRKQVRELAAFKTKNEAIINAIRELMKEIKNAKEIE
jgi:hypothetical protein